MDYHFKFNFLTTLDAVIGHDNTIKLAINEQIKVPIRSLVSLTCVQRMPPALKVNSPDHSANKRSDAHPFLTIQSQKKVNGIARATPKPNIMRNKVSGE